MNLFVVSLQDIRAKFILAFLMFYFNDSIHHILHVFLFHFRTVLSKTFLQTLHSQRYAFDIVLYLLAGQSQGIRPVFILAFHRVFFKGSNYHIHQVFICHLRNMLSKTICPSFILCDAHLKWNKHLHCTYLRSNDWISEPSSYLLSSWSASMTAITFYFKSSYVT